MINSSEKMQSYHCCAETTRLVTERIKVLSVAESKTLLQTYSRAAVERKANLDLTGGSNKGRFRRNRSTTRDPDFDNFDYKGPSRGNAATNVAATCPYFGNLKFIT